METTYQLSDFLHFVEEAIAKQYVDKDYDAVVVVDIVKIVLTALLVRATKPGVLVDPQTTKFNPHPILSAKILTICVNAIDKGILLPVICSWAMCNRQPLLNSLPHDELLQYLPLVTLTVTRDDLNKLSY